MKIVNYDYECIKEYKTIKLGETVKLEYYAFNRFIIMHDKHHPLINAADVLVYFKTKEEL